MVNEYKIRSEITNELGINVSVSVEKLTDQIRISVRPTDFNTNRGFVIISSLKWRTLRTWLTFDDFAGHIMHHIDSDINLKILFIDFFKSLTGSLSDLHSECYINGSSIHNETESWKRIEIAIERATIKIGDRDENSYIIEQTLILLQSILLCFELVPLEVAEETVVYGLPEGAMTRMVINKYERSKLNRSVCIRHFGPICQACGFNFEELYGILGKGFINVHHIIPVSKIGKEYIINPIRDLVPLCPNCHAMVHQTDPPVDLYQLIEIIQQYK